RRAAGDESRRAGLDLAADEGAIGLLVDASLGVERRDQRDVGAFELHRFTSPWNVVSPGPSSQVSPRPNVTCSSSPPRTRTVTRSPALPSARITDAAATTPVPQAKVSSSTPRS